MKMLFELIQEAHFSAITMEMYKNSIEKVFLSDLPIKVDWGKLDSHLLTQFYQQYPQQNPYNNSSDKPPFHRHFAVFYRGYGLSSMKGLFITQKLNLILADLIPIIQTSIIQFLQFMTATLFTQKRKNKNTKNQPVKSSKSEGITAEIDMLKLERISLFDTYQTAKSKGVRHTLWWFLKNIKIQEPTFKRLILIHRQVPETFVAEQTRKMKERAHKIKQSAKNKLGFINRAKQGVNNRYSEGLVDEIGRKRRASLFVAPDASLAKVNNAESVLYHPIRIQYFSDIPMSDLEMTYPEKTFSLKPMDKLYISVTIFIGIWAVLKELCCFTDTNFGFFVVCTCIFLMIRSIAWYRATESEYVRVLNSALCQSNLSRDQDAILSLVDSVDEQEFMETILAYFVLLKNEKQVITDSDGVDRLCEQFMSEAFGQNINVLVEGAMRKLTELGLFESGGDSKEESIRVKSLLDALSCAHQHYQSAIQTVRKIGVDGDRMKGDEQEEDEKREEVDEKEMENDGDESPPIIRSEEISDDHFDKDGDADFTPID